jgi:hypothetical protein
MDPEKVKAIRIGHHQRVSLKLEASMDWLVFTESSLEISVEYVHQ